MKNPLTEKQQYGNFETKESKLKITPKTPSQNPPKKVAISLEKEPNKATNKEKTQSIGKKGTTNKLTNGATIEIFLKTKIKKIEVKNMAETEVEKLSTKNIIISLSVSIFLKIKSLILSLNKTIPITAEKESKKESPKTAMGQIKRIINAAKNKAFKTPIFLLKNIKK